MIPTVLSIQPCSYSEGKKGTKCEAYEKGFSGKNGHTVRCFQKGTFITFSRKLKNNTIPFYITVANEKINIKLYYFIIDHNPSP